MTNTQARLLAAFLAVLATAVIVFVGFFAARLVPYLLSPSAKGTPALIAVVGVALVGLVIWRWRSRKKK